MKPFNTVKRYNLILDIDETLVKSDISSVTESDLQLFGNNGTGKSRVFYIWELFDCYRVTADEVKSCCVTREQKLTKTKQSLLTDNRANAKFDNFRCLKRIFVLKRPHLEEFLSFCRKYFNVYFWSAGKTLYVRQILDNILTFQPEGVFTRDHIIEAGVPHPIKPIAFLQKKTNNKINLSNTIHIDDIEITFSHNVDNGLLIPPFIGSPDDTCLLVLMKFLEKVKETDIDVRKIKKNIFTGECSKCNMGSD